MIQPPAAFQYVWALLWVVMIANVAIGHGRMRALVAQKGMTEEERQTFTRGAVGWITAYCGVELAIQLASHARTPFCFLAFPPSSGYGWGALATGWVVAAALLKWVWQGNGADLLARVAPAFSRYRTRPYTARQVRIGLTVLVLAAIVGNALASLSQRLPPGMC